MKKIQTTVLISTLLFSPLSFSADDCVKSVSEEKIAQYKKAIKGFGKNLKSELQTAMKSQGPVHAVSVCNEKADEITSNHAKKNNFYLGRTSLKVRNLSNVADEWEAKVLQDFEKRKAAGEDVATMDYAEIVETKDKREIRYMKAIGTASVCLACHGDKISEEVTTKLDSLYPEDQARGYKAGDVRGAFSISENIEKCE